MKDYLRQGITICIILVGIDLVFGRESFKTAFHASPFVDLKGSPIAVKHDGLPLQATVRKFHNQRSFLPLRMADDNDQGEPKGEFKGFGSKSLSRGKSSKTVKRSEESTTAGNTAKSRSKSSQSKTAPQSENDDYYNLLNDALKRKSKKSTKVVKVSFFNRYQNIVFKGSYATSHLQTMILSDIHTRMHTYYLFKQRFCITVFVDKQMFL